MKEKKTIDFMSGDELERRKNETANVEDGIARLAVYDFDGTTIDGFSPVELARDLREQHAMRFADALYLLIWVIGERLGFEMGEDLARDALFRPFFTLEKQDVEIILNRFYEQRIRPIIKQGCLDCIAADRAAGRVIVYVSAAFEPLVRHLKQDIDMDYLFAARLEESQNRYLPSYVGQVPISHGKFDVLKAFADRQYGEGNWVLDVAYGDSRNDIPLLSKAACPVAVDPDKKLAAHAFEHGWNIVSWKPCAQ